jgi:single-stranded-DNA-specific exonuclease
MRRTTPNVRRTKRRTAAERLPPPTASEAAFEALLTRFGADDDAAPRPAPAAAAPTPLAEEARVFLDELYAKRAEYLSRDRYASLGDAHGFNTKVAGVTFEGRQDVVLGLRPGEELALVREPHNPHDPNAIAVRYGTIGIGYLNREMARKLAPIFDAGERYTATVKHVTGGGARSTGVNVWVERVRAPVARRLAGERARSDEVLAALLGEHRLREPQQRVLDRIAAGKNTLAVFGTGRGKSLCFQYPAAVGALERGEKTIVLYPLRALANDQSDALERRLGPLGVRIFRANGAIDAGARAELMDALESGAWDIVCATPEFVQYHVERFAHERSRPARLVVDEAHHVAESSNRPAYGRIGEIVGALGSPQVLALTATANDATFARICSALGIESWVVDPTVRDNLSVVDARGTTNKPAYIERAVGRDGKAIVYCNSRDEATKLAERLRTRFAGRVAYYHAGVAAGDRARVETFFRSGEIRIVVATSAFGEGIDLPDVRDVFLYHLNFDLTEFNQQAGRAGRDGAPARIHLLFGERDRNINDFILERDAPTVHTLRKMYAGLRTLARDGFLRATHTDAADTLGLDKVRPSTVGVALRIFADVGLVEHGEDDDGRYARFFTPAPKVELTESQRYVEGEAERESFQRFAEFALSAKADVLETVINRPIYPGNVPLER